MINKNNISKPSSCLVRGSVWHYARDPSVQKLRLLQGAHMSPGLPVKYHAALSSGDQEELMSGFHQDTHTSSQVCKTIIFLKKHRRTYIKHNNSIMLCSYANEQ